MVGMFRDVDIMDLFLYGLMAIGTLLYFGDLFGISFLDMGNIPESSEWRATENGVYIPDSYY